MLKSDKQLLIEAQNEGQDWREVFREAVERYRGERGLATKVAYELGISHQTFYSWCKELDIELIPQR